MLPKRLSFPGIALHLGHSLLPLLLLAVPLELWWEVGLLSSAGTVYWQRNWILFTHLWLGWPLSLGKMADQRGRRGALLLDTWTFLAGGILQTFALDMFTIIIARFIIGFASGYSSVLVPIYLGESSQSISIGIATNTTAHCSIVQVNWLPRRCVVCLEH